MLPRQARGTNQVLLNRARALATLADGSDHQRLTMAHVASGKHLVDRGIIAFGIRLHVAMRIKRDETFFHIAR